MANSRRAARKEPLERTYRGPDIPMRVIRRFALQVAETFRPEKIILFGSYAYGTPHADSDVDILVVMPARNQLDQAYKIRCAVTAPFPMDLIVRTPKAMAWRLEERESFTTEITSKGKVLYEKGHRGVGEKGHIRSDNDRLAAARISSICLTQPVSDCAAISKLVCVETRRQSCAKYSATRRSLGSLPRTRCRYSFASLRW